MATPKPSRSLTTPTVVSPAGALGAGVGVSDDGVGAVVGLLRGGHPLVGGVGAGEPLAGGGLGQRVDPLGVVAEAAALVAQRVAEVHVQKPAVGLIFVAGVEEF